MIHWFWIRGFSSWLGRNNNKFNYDNRQEQHVRPSSAPSSSSLYASPTVVGRSSQGWGRILSPYIHSVVVRHVHMSSQAFPFSPSFNFKAQIGEDEEEEVDETGRPEEVSLEFSKEGEEVISYSRSFLSYSPQRLISYLYFFPATILIAQGGLSLHCISFRFTLLTPLHHHASTMQLTNFYPELGFLSHSASLERHTKDAIAVWTGSIRNHYGFLCLFSMHNNSNHVVVSPK